MADLPFSVDRTVGAAFLGNIAAGVFYGITSLQTYMYYKRNFQDLPSFKLLIFMLWFKSTLRVSVTSSSDASLREEYGCLATAANFLWLSSWVFVIILRASAELINSSLPGGSISLCNRQRDRLVLTYFKCRSLTSLGAKAFASRGFLAGSFLLLLRDSWLLYSALGSAVFADVFIAATLCFFLSTRRTGFKSTDNLVNTMMVYSINTGLLTSVCAMACFITYAIWPQDFGTSSHQSTLQPSDEPVRSVYRHIFHTL
ncbi:hypothetical protein PTI98_009661 [Pleurotus ostreatus]|nr:hypothetical protein PTI98_009661 [Pleurotus ostreatus]